MYFVSVKIFLQSASVEYDGKKTELTSNQIIRKISVQCTNDDDKQYHSRFMKATVQLKRLTASEIALCTQKSTDCKRKAEPKPTGYFTRSKKIKLDCEIVVENVASKSKIERERI